MSCDVGEVTESLENEQNSPTLLSLLLRHRLFTYVTWRATHATKLFLRNQNNRPTPSAEPGYICGRFPTLVSNLGTQNSVLMFWRETRSFANPKNTNAPTKKVEEGTLILVTARVPRSSNRTFPFSTQYEQINEVPIHNNSVSPHMVPLSLEAKDSL